MNTIVKAKLAAVAPSIAFTSSREVDEFNKWDGDGPDPEESGHVAYLVTVKASAIVAGEWHHGSSSLGSSYFLPDEPIGDVHGYLLQMLDEAAEELARSVGDESELAEECVFARALLKVEMRNAYDAQRAEIERGAVAL